MDDDDGDNVPGLILKEEDEGCGWMMMWMWMMMMVIMCQDESSRRKMKVVDG